MSTYDQAEQAVAIAVAALAAAAQEDAVREGERRIAELEKDKSIYQNVVASMRAEIASRDTRIALLERERTNAILLGDPGTLIAERDELRNQVRNLTNARRWEDTRVDAYKAEVGKWSTMYAKAVLAENEASKQLADARAALALRRDVNLANVPENYLTLSTRIVELEGELAKTSTAELDRKQNRIDELEKANADLGNEIQKRYERDVGMLGWLEEVVGTMEYVARSGFMDWRGQLAREDLL